MSSVSIGELVASGVLQIGDGYRTKRSEHAEQGYRIIRVADVMEGAVSFTGPDFVSEKYTKAIGTKIGKPGDILLTTKGTVGRVAVLPNTNEQVVYSPQVCFFRVLDAEVVNPAFLRYWFSSPEFWHQAADRMNNTDMAAYINLADIRSLKLTVPDISEQRSIAEVLGALDDKIAANTKLNSLIDAHMSLEYTAASHDSATALPLSEVAEFHNRKRVPLSAREREQQPGNVPYYGASGVFGTVDTAIFDEPLVLVGEDGSVINDDGTPVSQYIWGPAWVNNHAHVLTGKGISTELLFLAIRRTQVATLVTGAVQPKINMGNLKGLTLEIPSMDRRGRLEQIVKAETASKRAVIEENRTLAATRDTLLPQLMSGKLRVKDAAGVLENAGV